MVLSEKLHDTVKLFAALKRSLSQINYVLPMAHD